MKTWNAFLLILILITDDEIVSKNTNDHLCEATQEVPFMIMWWNQVGVVFWFGFPVSLNIEHFN